MGLRQFGRNRLEEQIGRGGMGEVCRAVDRTGPSRSSCRPTGSPPMPSPGAVRRESALAARLPVPHIIPIHDNGEIDNQQFIDRGSDLASVLAQHGPLPAERAVRVVSQAARALDAAP